MKESISYTFLLNIIITFIFVCFAVIMGIFSYYRAFRANTAILNSIEKYEGFNCLSRAEAEKSLQNIGYKVPFSANKKTDGVGKLLTNFVDYGYSVIYYAEKDNNDYVLLKDSHRQYQYGVFTYMYMDLPVISSILKIPVYGKTRVMYEFRPLYESSNGVYSDERLSLNSFDQFKDFFNGNGNNISDVHDFIMQYAAYVGAGQDLDLNMYKARIRYIFDANGDGVVNSTDATDYILRHSRRDCGIYVDWSKY